MRKKRKGRERDGGIIEETVCYPDSLVGDRARAQRWPPQDGHRYVRQRLFRPGGPGACWSYTWVQID
jgi:hypothetical protein